MFHRDQGAQFTSTEFTNRLEMAGIRISLDGRGRALDNVFVERRWRTVKYEEVYLKDYETPRQATREFGQYFAFYNEKRLHQALAYQTPAVVYFESSVSQAILIYASNCLDDGVHLSVPCDLNKNASVRPLNLVRKPLRCIGELQTHCALPLPL